MSETKKPPLLTPRELRALRPASEKSVGFTQADIDKFVEERATLADETDWDNPDIWGDTPRH